ncbi:hypothetical protein GOODEAATRI_026185, partial [Goodea atripinnis]
VIWSSSCATRGAMTDGVGDLSSDMTSVFAFSGCRAFTTSSATVMPGSVRVQRSFLFLRTSGGSRAAEIAGCSSKKRSTISTELFQRVTTSITSLCRGRPSNLW